MSDFNSVSKVKADNQIINTINSPDVYPAFQMLIKSKRGIQNFEVMFAIRIFMHFILCVSVMTVIGYQVDLSQNLYLNFHMISIFMLLYLFGQILRILNKKEVIIVKHIFKKISNMGEKETLIYFLATLRASSFIGNKDTFNRMIDKKDYKTIHKELARIFEIVDKENKAYRPTTPTHNLLPL